MVFVILFNIEMKIFDQNYLASPEQKQFYFIISFVFDIVHYEPIVFKFVNKI